MDKSPSTIQLANDFDNSSMKDDGNNNNNNSNSINKAYEARELKFVVGGGDKSLPASSSASIDDGKSSSSDSDSIRAETPIDPWDIIEEEDTGPKWADLSVHKKIWKVLWVITRICFGLGLLYVFVCSLDILQDSFQLLSGRTAGEIFTSSIINNPVCGLMVGVFVTVLVQSSSTSTSIVVSMVGSGILGVPTAIPIIMGANIGTTVTNTLVALTQSPDRNVFRRAFAGATVHDMFNWLTVLILLPLEVITGYLFRMTEAMTKNIGSSSASTSETPQFLKVITEPITKMIVQVDKKVITAIAEDWDRQKFPLVKYYCSEVSAKYATNYSDEFNETAFNLVNNEIFTYNVERVNGSDDIDQFQWTEVLDVNSTKCTHWFVGSGLPGAALSETAVGGILLVGSLVVLMACLIGLVKILNSLLRGPMRIVVRRYINADFPGYAAFLTGYFAMLCGAGITILVQSSSVFTSTLTPLVGIGVVTVERVYPLTLGSNIGTTVTGILAALTADANMIRFTLQIALCHLFFNISGILIWYPIPFMRRIPTNLAKKLGNTTAKYRWFAVFYLILMFLLMPMLVFGLSMAGWYVLVGVGVPIIILFAFIVIVNIMQTRRPNWLPRVLRSWDFLPRPLRSLGPYDRAVSACLHNGAVNRCRGHCCVCCRPTDSIVEGCPVVPDVVINNDSRRSSDSLAADAWVRTDVEKKSHATTITRTRTSSAHVVIGVTNQSYVDTELNYESFKVSRL